MPVSIRKAGDGDHERIDAFYAEMGKGVIASGCQTAMIAEYGDRIVGAVRLCLEHGCLVLRMMVIQEGYRRRGIGRRMLAELTRHMRDRVCYCLPYAHLTEFYGGTGFVPIPEIEAPEHLRERYRGYLAR